MHSHVFAQSGSMTSRSNRNSLAAGGVTHPQHEPQRRNGAKFASNPPYSRPDFETAVSMDPQHERQWARIYVISAWPTKLIIG
jgi:hypothetical protein